MMNTSFNQTLIIIYKFLARMKIFVFSLHAYMIERLIQKSVALKSLKNDPLGNNWHKIYN